MWLFGSDVGGGGGGIRKAVVESDVGGVIWLWLVVEAIVVVVMVAWLALWLRWLRCGWSKITIGKEKHYLKGSQPVNTKNSL